MNISFYDNESKNFVTIPSSNYSNSSTIEILAYLCSPKYSSMIAENLCVIKLPCSFVLNCSDNYGNLIEENDRIILQDEFQVKKLNIL